MRIATVTTKNGTTWTTRIHGTDQSICNYFLGVRIDVSPDPEKELLSRVISVEIDGKIYTPQDNPDYVSPWARLY